MTFAIGYQSLLKASLQSPISLAHTLVKGLYVGLFPASYLRKLKNVREEKITVSYDFSIVCRSFEG